MVSSPDSLGPLHRAHFLAWLASAVSESAPISIAYPTPSNVLGFRDVLSGKCLSFEGEVLLRTAVLRKSRNSFYWLYSIGLADVLHTLSIEVERGTHRPEPLKGKLRPVPTFVHRGSDIGAKEFQDV